MTGQEALRTVCSGPTATLLDAAGNHTCAQQSRQATLVPSMSLPAGSDTVTSLYRVLFHLSLMVLVCYWSQTQILLCMSFTTCFTHYSQGTRLLEDTPCTEKLQTTHRIFTLIYALFQGRITASQLVAHHYPTTHGCMLRFPN